MGEPIVFRLWLRDESDVAAARHRCRELSRDQGLSESACEALVTAVSEIARNAVVHAGGGEILLGTVEGGGVKVIAKDEGPGIPDVDSALRDGYSTGDGLGLGLPSARRLVDRFILRSTEDQGTVVTLEKWAESRRQCHSPRRGQ